MGLEKEITIGTNSPLLGRLHFDKNEHDYEPPTDADFGSGRIGDDEIIALKEKVPAKKEGGLVRIEGTDYWGYELVGEDGRVEQELFPLDWIESYSGDDTPEYKESIKRRGDRTNTSQLLAISGSAQTQFVSEDSGIEIGIHEEGIYGIFQEQLMLKPGEDNSHITDYNDIIFNGKRVSYSQLGVLADIKIELGKNESLERTKSQDGTLRDLGEIARTIYQAQENGTELSSKEKEEVEDALINHILSSRSRKLSLLPDVVQERMFRPKKRPNDNSLVDKLIDAGIPEEAIAGNEGLWDYLRNVEENEVVSANQNFHVADKDGQRWLLKITGDENKARMEAASNYYLGQHFDFIVPGMAPVPIEANGIYMTLQQEVPKTIDRGVDYWMASFALFHREAEKILGEKGIFVSDKVLKSVDYLEEQFDESKGNHELTFRKAEIRDAIDYLMETDYKIMVHGDAKEGNRFGSYLVDLESCGRMHAGIDLAMVLMQSNIKKEDWDVHLRKYLEIKGTSGNFDQEFQELKEGTHYAALYMATKEVCGSSLRRLDKETRKDNEQLVYSLAA
jgi:hypothetical protein